MNNDNYILVNGKVEPCEDFGKFGKWFQNSDRRIILTQRDNKTISTVFLGMNHNWSGGPPILFETMVFNDGIGGEEENCERYSTLEEAKLGHIKLCQKHLGSYTEEDLFLDLL